MKLYNLKHPREQLDFPQAVLQSIGTDGGLFYPAYLPRFEDITEILAEPFVPRSQIILNRLLGDDFDPGVIPLLVERAFGFPVPLVSVNRKIAALELFHGPTLAFKDFGARFMAGVLGHLVERGDHTGPLTILCATSGDTGAAVAHAFYGMPDIKVVILYPEGRISGLQEKLFCTLGGNICTLAVNGDFDACQSLVKQCFTDDTLTERYGLNSANSINVARLFAQTSYYFEALAKAQTRDKVVIAVPSGNFGNLSAGLLAQQMGLPVSAFIAATNANDTVPRYLQSAVWQVNKTIQTRSNSMDVSSPNNWPRVEECFRLRNSSPARELRYSAISEDQTIAAQKRLYEDGYTAEPHAAVAYAALAKGLRPDETGVFLCTAHPAKFKDSVESALGIEVALPEQLAESAGKASLSIPMAASVDELKKHIAQAWV